MANTDLHKAIMSSRGVSLEEANRLVEEMKERVREGEEPDMVLLDEGYEPDYIFDIFTDDLFI